MLVAIVPAILISVGLDTSIIDTYLVILGTKFFVNLLVTGTSLDINELSKNVGRN